MKLSPSPDAPQSIKVNAPSVYQSPSRTNQPAISETPNVQPSAVTSEPAPLDEKLSSKYAELAKREKILRSKFQSREQALKAREEALAAKEKQYSPDAYLPKAEISQRFEKDPYAFMKDHNISGDKLTQSLLNQPSPMERMIEELRAEVASLKGLPDQTKNLLAEREKQDRDQAINVIRSDVKRLVLQDPQFEIIKSTGSEDEVVKRIEDTLDKEGIILSVNEAAEAIEKELAEELVKYSQLEKIKKLIAPAVQVENPKSLQPQAKTLAHSQVSSTQKPMNARERAIAMLEGNLT